MNARAWFQFIIPGLRPSALQRHDQIAIGVDHNVLPEYAFGSIDAVTEQPPKEAVARRTLRWRYGLLHPVVDETAGG